MKTLQAMTYLKLKGYMSAEDDATTSITLNPNYIKSYQRRSKARLALGKFRAAIRDLDYANSIICSSDEDGEDGKKNSKIKKELQKDKENCVHLFIRAIKSCPKRRVTNIDIMNEGGIDNVNTHHGVTEIEPKTVNNFLTSQDVINSSSSKKFQIDSEAKIKDTSFASVEVSDNHDTIGIENNSRAINKYDDKATTKKSNPKTFQEFQTIWRSLSEKSNKLNLLTKQSSKNIHRMFHTNNFDDTDLFSEMFDILLSSSLSLPSSSLGKKDTLSGKVKKKIDSFIKSLLTIPNIDILTAMMSSGQRIIVNDHLKLLDDSSCFLSMDSKQMILTKFNC